MISILLCYSRRLFSEEEKEKKIHELKISVSHIGFVYGSVCQPNLVSVVDLTDTRCPETTEPGPYRPRRLMGAKA